MTAAWVGSNFTPEPQRTEEQKQVLALSDTFLSELQQADEWVIGVPMHNFGISSALKLWIDQIVRAGKAFAYVDGKPQGLLTDKKVTFVIATGGMYDAGTQMASSGEQLESQDFITFGPVHLEVRDAERTARFWQKLAGFERRASNDDAVEVGTADETLLVLHGGARTPYKRGHSGLYHVAIHSPNARDFARLLKRFLDLRYPIGPTDHTISKSLYLDDPDGINVEFTLETPERFQGMRVVGNRITFVGTDGVERSGSYALDLEQVFQAYEEGSEKEPVAKGTKVGHLHLYVGHLDQSYEFYKSLGMKSARYWPPMQAGDLGAGGAFDHRIAINTWQGVGAPPSPADTARMRHFELRFDTLERLQAALAANPSAVDDGDAYALTDPSGIKLRLAKNPTIDSRQ